MADNKPINWSYPLPSRDTNSSPLQLLINMASAKGGHYPTGENGLWHGGVHFDEGTATLFDQTSVRCMADGEVIAYRIDERYPVSEFTDEIPRVKRAPFSTGFVLVKHSLQPTPLRNADGSTAEGQTPPVLTLYSLYMHLLDWAGYQAQPDLPRPAFWEAKRYTVNTQNQGLSVRAGPSRGAAKLSELPKGTEITIGRAEGDFSKLVSLISGTAQPTLPADDEGQLPGYVSTGFLKPHSEPAECGKVVVLDSGVPIKAGDLIGPPGLYQNHDSAAQHMVHVELFSCDDVPTFIAQSRAWASRLPDDQQTLLKVYKGASKLIAHRDDINTENPPRLSDHGTQIGVDLMIPQSLLDGLPVSRKIRVKDAADNTMHWWRLDGLFADAHGNPVDGWLAEQELITTRHSPWEWEGFQCVEETGTAVEKLAYSLDARRLLSTEEQQNYRAQINKADGGPILTLARLHDIIDTDKNGKLSSREIRAALAKPWQAQLLGQLITRYESEWFWEKSKWDELDPLLEEEPGTPNLIWQTEKQRIEKLSWWSDLAEKHGIGGNGKAWHFHPVGIATLLLLEESSDCGCNLGKIFSCVRLKGQSATIYGPLYTGSIGLHAYANWDETIAAGVVTEEEKSIFIAMSSNEGNIDSLQSYDSEILTAGAMQKTINSSGSGEFPIQVFDFKVRHPQLYQSLFENCGWSVEGPRTAAKMYYNQSSLTKDRRYTGPELKKLIREGFTESSYTKKQKIASTPLGSILKAITHEKFQEQQVLDFAKRLQHEVMEIKPTGFEFKLREYLKSPLGKATVLDHHINRPGYVSRDFGAALQRFLDSNPSTSKAPANWGDNHAENELSILNDYGIARRMAIVNGKSVAPSRYQHLKDKL
ncbi:SH3 domain-containing protein [Pseudomonas knackmussii]|uniref:SH3 domain-containing protein n=1 Tax=Pseudomonas knackmussii TaxID=65741 RepID=A0ABY4KRB2_9PSED|nr:SH3 domain-containing protein [Pseudomonas knackmussii]UPQ82273.1 SH3 domain-containing protein [Pseudomonas knackmussii]